MSQKLKTFVSQKWTAFALVIVCALLIYTGKKIFDDAAPPSKDKPCDFIYPNTVDQTKPTTISITAPTSSLQFEQRGGTINDASCLNKTAVYGVVRVASEDDVRNAIQFARENGLKITSAGQRHSMGGQSFVKDGLVLDMRGLNHISLDAERNVLHVQSGATWLDVQQFLDARGLSVKAMQSINIFTIGGTLSVNAHGITRAPEQIAPTVRSFHIMLSDGAIQQASPTEHPDLFRAALGGYGLFGVILDADLEVVPNEMYTRDIAYVDYKDLPAYVKQHIDGNDQVGLAYARLSVSPTSFLTETAVHTFTKTAYDGAFPSMQTVQHDWLDRLVFNFSKTGDVGRWTRWMLEKYLQPHLDTCLTRNQAMSQKEVCLVTRNQAMNDPKGYLKNRLPDTDILQEYFIPPDKMADFVDGLRKTVKDNRANLLNATVRVVNQDTITALPYAPQDMFAFVLYFNQQFTQQDADALKKTTSDLIDLAISLHGTYYLPYQLYSSPEQLRAAYPTVDAFFAEKKKLDPLGLFTNTFYEKYGK